MKFFKICMFVGVIMGALGLSVPAFAEPLGGDGGLIRKNLTDSTKDVFENPSLTAPQFIGQMIEVLLGVLGIFFLGLLIYGGILWMNYSGGGKDEKNVNTAKAVIQNAVIGLIIVVASYAITAYVVDKILGAATTP